MILENQIKVSKENFFDTCIADILRAIEGNCLIGAFTLSFCAIGALSTLGAIAEGSGTKDNVIYKNWTKKWLVPISPNCKAEQLYAYRCALVHTHGAADAFAKIGFDTYFLTHDQPDKHWQLETPDLGKASPIINLDSLVAEVALAGFQFFDEVIVKPGQEDETQRALKNLMAYVDRRDGSLSTKLLNNMPYSEKHRCLSQFDNGAPSPEDLRQKIHELYQPIGRCRCSPGTLCALKQEATGSLT